ncbi:MAG: hypothetical protein JO015_00445 [Verrucomicrobia bacterium]|nr:hypothetical protein [Verrucomicrobiota bacterium]
MLDLSYRLLTPYEEFPDPDDLAKATEVDFRFRVALGDLILAAPPSDFSARWGWIPLIDFAVSVREILSHLKRGGARSQFEFTESEATLTFVRHETGLVITASYAPGEIPIPLSSFEERLRWFEGGLRADLVKNQPALERHPVFNRLLPEE